ncbi:MAG: transcription antitermination factor NusB [Thiobacillaceae bacterium]|jgi:N utilization substance protein B|nr:transcription antitermination factor NusB [Thiobacillaceae bacterium]
MASAKAGGKSRGSRRMSRELALRALYQWQLAGGDLARLLAHAEEDEDYVQANAPHFQGLLEGVLKEAGRLDEALAHHLDRPAAQLSPIEHAILLIGAYELAHSLDVPYRVAINEAVELAKRYGGTDGHKYVNGVLDKLAKVLRSVEIEAAGR